MNKFLSYILVFSFVLMYILFDMYNDAKRQIDTLEGQKNALYGNVKYLEGEIEKRNKSELEASRKKEELTKLVKRSKDECWNRIIDDNDPVLMQLRKD